VLCAEFRSDCQSAVNPTSVFARSDVRTDRREQPDLSAADHWRFPFAATVALLSIVLSPPSRATRSCCSFRPADVVPELAIPLREFRRHEVRSAGHRSPPLPAPPKSEMKKTGQRPRANFHPSNKLPVATEGDRPRAVGDLCLLAALADLPPRNVHPERSRHNPPCASTHRQEP
jgi:hypothetical protein